MFYHVFDRLIICFLVNLALGIAANDQVSLLTCILLLTALTLPCFIDYWLLDTPFDIGSNLSLVDFSEF